LYGEGASNVVIKGMKTLQVKLPDAMAREVESAVKSGIFETADEVVRVALREFISHRRFELMELQQLQDIEMASGLSGRVPGIRI